MQHWKKENIKVGLMGFETPLLSSFASLNYLTNAILWYMYIISNLNGGDLKYTYVYHY